MGCTSSTSSPEVKNQDSSPSSGSTTSATAAVSGSGSSEQKTEDRIRIIQIGDHYNVFPNEKHENCGGAARFVEHINSYKIGGSNYDEGFGQPVVIHCGDEYAPSVESQITLGKHVVPILNAMFKDCQGAICLGNHSIDNGIETFERFAKMCKFPWLCANFKNKQGEHVVPSTREYVVVDAPISSNKEFKVALVGIIESEWVDALSCVDSEDIVVENQVACLERLGPKMCQEGANLIIVIAHQRMPRDRYVAENASKFCSYIASGHDHEIIQEEVNGIPIIKAGADFKNFAVIDITLKKNENKEKKISSHVIGNFKCKMLEIVKSMPENQEIVEGLKTLKVQLAERMKKVIGATKVDLDCRFSSVRTGETNIANFVADCVRRAIVPTPQVVLLNSGTLRADALLPKGNLTVGDLMRMLPMLDPLCVISIRGSDLIRALDNGVSQLPALEGRFPCISGMRFKLDSSKPAGQRVIKDSVFICGAPIDLEKHYTLASKAYIALNGKDGYDMFPECEVVADQENCTTLAQAVTQFFLMHQAAERLANAGASHSFSTNHDSRIENTVKFAAKKFKQLRRTNSSIESLASAASAASAASGGGSTTTHSAAGSDHLSNSNLPNLENDDDTDNDDDNEDGEEEEHTGKTPLLVKKVKKQFKIAPKVEGRIIDVAEKKQEEQEGETN